MRRADSFIQLYNELDDFLRELTGEGREIHYSVLVGRAARIDAVVEAYAGCLLDYGALRNAIVHHRQYPGEIIAEPNEGVVRRLEGILEAIRSPRRLIPTFQRSLRLFAPSEPLGAALRYMDDNDYSQVVVRGPTTDGAQILSTEGLVRWLRARAKKGTVDFDATVGDALAYEEVDSFVVMGRNHTVFDARKAFTSVTGHGNPRLCAIIITHSGRPTEMPLGIVTPWDVIDLEEAREGLEP